MRHDLPIPIHQVLHSAGAIEALLPTDVEQLHPPTGQTAELVPLLLGLSLAVVLPPDAIIAPHGSAEPVVRSDPLALLGAAAVEAALGRPAIAVGAGHVFLEEVDRRLSGLVARLNAYRVTDAPMALVTTGLVTAGSAPGEGFRATPRELWDLAKTALSQRGQLCEPVPQLGADAFVTLRGDHTAQVAWLNGDQLATVGVTSQHADQAWLITSARSLAELAGRP
jgi:hypothetical protein